MACVTFIHGLANKPESAYLHSLWARKLGHDNGLDLANYGVLSNMVYWADVLYESPDTDLAAYEAAAGDEPLREATPVAPIDLSDLGTDDANRLRALAAAVGVDPANPPNEEPSPEELLGVRTERVPVPAWLRNRIMARFVRDAHHYFFNVEFSPRMGETFDVRDELQQRFIDMLQKGAEDRPLIVVSHSMGTIIAYDCLMHRDDCPAVDGLVTVGSPLGLDEVQDFFPSWSRENGFPTAKLNGQWVNVFDPLDPVAGFDPHIGNDYKHAGRVIVEDVREDNWGTWRHSISKYLQGHRLRTHLAQMLGTDWP